MVSFTTTNAIFVSLTDPTGKIISKFEEYFRGEAMQPIVIKQTASLFRGFFMEIDAHRILSWLTDNGANYEDSL